MADIRAYVANFMGNGLEISKHQDKCIRDTLTFKCDGFTFRFIQKPEIITGKIESFIGRFTESTEVLIKDVKENDVNNALSVLEKICRLLSFAGLCRVICYGYEYPDGSGFGSHSSVTGEANYFRPTIAISDGRQTVEFIEKCYSVYKHLEEERKLNVVIDYLVQAERPGQPIELKLIIGFVILENLKDTYARSMNITYKDGCYRKVDGKCYSFKELLILMLGQVQMQRNLSQVVKLRNEIIHSGVIRKPYPCQWETYEELHDLLREYLLRLLGYDGYYLTYVTGQCN